MSNTEFRINTHTTGSQSESSVTSLRDGGFVVTWQSDGQDGDSGGIYGQRYDSSGAVAGSEFQINSYTADSQSNPSVTSLTDGGFFVTWQSDGQDGDDHGIYGQRYDSTGAAAGNEFQINTYTTSHQYDPSVTSLSDGGLVVTWQSDGQDGDSHGVFGQRYDETGAAAGSEFKINTYTESGQQSPSVTSLSDGGFVVTWASYGQDGINGDTLNGIFGQRYDSTGSTAGSEFQINTHTQYNQQSPSVTSLSDGGFVVTWQSYGGDGWGGNPAVSYPLSWGVYGQRYDSTGNTIGSEFQVNTYAMYTQYEPSVASLSDGGFVVTWTSDGGHSDGYGISGQGFDSTGSAAGSEFQINTYTEGCKLNLQSPV